jgi:hypothetical protein
LAEDPRLLHVQQWLGQVNFAECLIALLEAIGIDSYDPEDSAVLYSDPIYLRTSCLYGLIGRGARNAVLRPSFLTYRCLDSLKPSFVRAPVYVKTNQWKAIRALCTEDAAKLMTSFLALSIEVLQEDLEHLAEHQVVVVSFITKMMRFEPEIVYAFDQLNIARWLLPLLLKFKKSTILHGEIRDFVITALENSLFAMKMIELFFPLFIGEMREKKESRILRPFLYQMIKKMVEIVKGNPSAYETVLTGVPDYERFIGIEFREYEERMASLSGGSPFGAVATLLASVFPS